MRSSPKSQRSHVFGGSIFRLTRCLLPSSMNRRKFLSAPEVRTSCFELDVSTQAWCHPEGCYHRRLDLCLVRCFDSGSLYLGFRQVSHISARKRLYTQLQISSSRESFPLYYHLLDDIKDVRLSSCSMRSFSSDMIDPEIPYGLISSAFDQSIPCRAVSESAARN